jgi:MFS family permease
MVGLGETFVPAFILFIGLGEVPAGLVTTLPLLAGACMQLVSPWMVVKLNSNRKWVIICATLQALTFIPLIVAGVTEKLPLLVAFLVASIYWGAGMGAGPAWNSWMGTLIPGSVQVGFFTRRTRITQLTVLLGFVMGGVALQFLPSILPKGEVFALLFSVAFVCRVLSLNWLRRQPELFPPSTNNNSRIVNSFFAFSKDPTIARLFRYLLSVQFAAHLAAPFFTAYMLVQLNLHYWEYAFLVATSYITKIVMLPRLGKIASMHGTRALLWLGGVGVIGLPALWLVSHEFYFLVFIQMLSGLFWAAYELASLLLLWEVVPIEDRTASLTVYNLGNSFAMSASSLLGGAVLLGLGKNAFAYSVLFVASSVVRGLTVLLLGGISSHKLDWFPVALRTLTLRPQFGLLFPVLGPRLNKKAKRKN